MKYIKIPEILSYTKGPKQVRHSYSRPCKVPTHGKTWEQKQLEAIEYEERRYRASKPKKSSIRANPIPRVKKVKKVKKEIVFACVRPGFTSYHRVRYYE